MGLAVEGADRGGAGLVVVVVQRLLDVREAAVAHEARRRHRPEQQQPCEWAGAGAGARACENGDEHNACVSWRRVQRLRACDGTQRLRHARTTAFASGRDAPSRSSFCHPVSSAPLPCCGSRHSNASCFSRRSACGVMVHRRGTSVGLAGPEARAAASGWDLRCQASPPECGEQPRALRLCRLTSP